MRLVYDVQRADLESLLQYHYEHGSATAGMRALTHIALPGLVAVLFSVVGIVQRAWILPVMGLVLGLVLRATLPRVMRFSVRASIARSLAQGTAASTLGRHELEATDDGLVDRAAGEQYLHPWDELTDVVILPDRAHIYLGPSQAYIIPERGVREGDYQGFVRWIQKRVAAAQGRGET